MDQLDIDAKAASDMRVSYGKYIANYKGKAGAVRKPEREEETGEVRLCVVCEKRIPANAHGKRKTCSATCADELRRRRKDEAMQRRRQNKLEKTKQEER